MFISLPLNPDLSNLSMKLFEKTSGKGECAGNQHFLLFTQCFLPSYFRVSIMSESKSVFTLAKAKILTFSKV